MKHFIIKKLQDKRLQKRSSSQTEKENIQKNDENANGKNKKNAKTLKNMDTKEKIELAASILDDMPKVKKLRKDKGLIEKTESSKIILTEDNKELLKD